MNFIKNQSATFGWSYFALDKFSKHMHT